jgi:hypothetical protein
MTTAYGLMEEPRPRSTVASAAPDLLAASWPRPADIAIVAAVRRVSPYSIMVVLLGADTIGVLLTALKNLSGIVAKYGPPLNLEVVRADRIGDYDEYSPSHQCTIQAHHEDPAIIDILYAELEKARMSVPKRIVPCPRRYELKVVSEDNYLFLLRITDVLERHDINMVHLSGSTYPSLAKAEKNSTPRLCHLRFSLEIAEEKSDVLAVLESEIRNECMAHSPWKGVILLEELPRDNEANLPSLNSLLTDLRRAHRGR